MAMSQPALKSAIENAFLSNMPSPTAAQTTAFATTADAIATAIIACVENATLTYTAGLVAPSGGGPVTGVLTGVTIT